MPIHPDTPMQTWETTCSVGQLLSHTKEALMTVLSQEIPDVHTVTGGTPLWPHPSHGHTPHFFSLLGDSPKPWSHEATGWRWWGCVLGMRY